MNLYWITFAVVSSLTIGIQQVDSIKKAECYQNDFNNKTCKYRCHCPVSGGKCDGQCRSRNCDQRWSGPNCQRGNVVYKGLQVWVGNRSLEFGGGNQSDIIANSELCFEHTGDIFPAWIFERKCSRPIVGNVVIVMQPGVPELVLCEVLIYECDDYWFGPACVTSCKCRDINEVCNKATGNCLSGCQAGLTGASCEQQCPNRKYGPDCAMDCHCKFDSRCDKVTGSCLVGCAAGWFGDSCEKECDAGRFGDYCQKTCHCLNGADKCDRFTGTCDDSQCAAGWKGSTCQQECPTGSHGPGCTIQCNCLNNAPCDRVTGACKNGCPKGFRGDDCHKVATTTVRTSPSSITFTSTSIPTTLKTSFSTPSPTKSATITRPDSPTRTVCPTGTFGSGCTGVCRCKDNKGCDRETGNCSKGGGCVTGYNGTACQIKKPKEPEPFPVIPVAAGLGGFVFLIIVIVIIVVIFRRCRDYRMEEDKGFDNKVIMKTNKAYDHESVDGDFGASSVHTDPNIYHTILEEEDEVDEGVYVNSGETLSGETEVSVSEIWAELHRRLDDNSLITEYKALPVGLLEIHNVSEKPGNAAKCRFKGIVPYDKNRVILTPYKDVPFSDFINASYIEGHNKSNAYIAAEGPIETTRDDFWRMVWQVDSSKIVMLTNILEKGKRKCDKYWPDSSAILCGEIMVEHVETQNYPAYVVRTLNVKKQGEKSRCIRHYHYRNWPDKGVPKDTTTLIMFREKVEEHTEGPFGPIVVHCSSGIGRTGSFIAFDHQMQRARAEGVIDVYNCVYNMRRERLNMVPTSEKYQYLYMVLTDGILCDGTTIANDDFLRIYPTLVEFDGASKSKIQREFKTLQSLKPKASEPCESAQSPENIDKNRSKEILAADNARVVLVSAVQGTTDYINAVFVPTFLTERSLIASQIPLAETTVDFWRMVYEQKCRCVVMISRSRDEESRSYWPPQGETTKISSFKVTTENYLPSEQFDIRNMRVWYKPSGDANGLAVRNFTFSNWDTRSNLNSDILALVHAVRDWCKHSESGPIIVMCSDGTEKSGVFCAVLSIVERIMTEKNVNVMVTVKQIREPRRQFISEEQYRLLYDIVRTYFDETRNQQDILY